VEPLARQFAAQPRDRKSSHTQAISSAPELKAKAAQGFCFVVEVAAGPSLRIEVQMRVSKLVRRGSG
jgi:hypothetical protein